MFFKIKRLIIHLLVKLQSLVAVSRNDFLYGPVLNIWSDSASARPLVKELISINGFGMMLCSLMINVFSAEAESQEDDGGQSQATPPQVNGSPRPSHTEAPALSQPEAYDVTLQRKDNEGFGFVILTSKNKPPPGGKRHTKNRIYMYIFS